MSYIYFTRIVVVLIRSALHYKATWIAPLIFELGTLLFYIFSGMAQRESGIGLADDGKGDSVILMYMCRCSIDYMASNFL